MERLETLNHIFKSFCLFWENEEQQEIYHPGLTPDWCWGGSRDHGILVSSGEDMLQIKIYKESKWPIVVTLIVGQRFKVLLISQP